VSDGLRVIIVGAGIAGCSAAFFARQLLGPGARILVMEQAHRIGGRVWTIDVGACRVEAGAGVVHASNRYLCEFVERLGLHRLPEGHRAHARWRASRSQPLFGVWNGAAFDVIGPGSRPAILARLLARDPVSLVQAVARARSMVRSLNRIYAVQSAGTAFATPEALLQCVGLHHLAQEVGSEHLRAHHVSARFVAEIIDPVSRNSYCQDAGINALASLVCMAGTGLAGGSIFSVREGNEQLCHGLLRLSAAEVQTGCAAAAITRASGWRAGEPRYQVLTEQGQTLPAHAVLLCTPVAGIRVAEWEHLEAAATVPYQLASVTFVTGQLNRDYFTAPELPHLPGHVLTEEVAGLPFSSIARAGTTPAGRPVYRIFSRAPLGERDLDMLFAGRDHTQALSWSAYPTLTPSRDHPPFRIDTGLYYANALERTVSTMETEVIASRNVVNLLGADRDELAR
jgi:hypothetical protein